MGQPFPLLGVDLDDSNSLALDISRARLAELGIDPDDQNAMGMHIYTGKYRYGGYGEQRSIYDSSRLFCDDSEPREIHLGIDLWTEAGHAVYAPWEGTIISAHDNAGKGDYGPTLIIRHDLEDRSIHSLYGHLSRGSLNYAVGERVEQGMRLAEIGVTEVNGGWLPHLHFQLIYDLEGHSGDYLGVCRRTEWERYQMNCPDPSAFNICP